ncbi:MAG TPA: hypothetical protein PKY59_25015 [Pyrinomonadaceae bacterium]|nr:hypothetical protein [Pyrinomonadaceae bacterium]
MKNFILAFAFVIFGISAADAQNFTDIRKVDFQNYTHTIGNKSVKFEDGLQVGSCTKDAEGIPTGDVWSVNKTQYGDLDGDGKEEAFFAAIANICDGNMVTNEAVLVYKLEKGKIVKLPEFEYYDEGCETGKVCGFSRSPGVSVDYDKTLKMLIVGQAYATEDDAICCPSLERNTWFKWDGAKFVEVKKSKITEVKVE